MGSEPNRVTLDELVSYNLRRAREMRGWTQAEAAERVSAHLGRVWSQQVYGDAERAYRNPKRVKVFTGEEMLALAQAFDLPIPWFYLPTTIETEVGARSGEGSISGRDLLWLLMPEAHPREDRNARTTVFRRRLDELAREAGFVPGQGDLPAPLGLSDYTASKRRTYLDAERIDELEREMAAMKVVLRFIGPERIENAAERLTEQLAELGIKPGELPQKGEE